MLILIDVILINSSSFSPFHDFFLFFNKYFKFEKKKIRLQDLISINLQSIQSNKIVFEYNPENTSPNFANYSLAERVNSKMLQSINAVTPCEFVNYREAYQIICSHFGDCSQARV